MADGGIKSWMWRHRTSPRVAFLLQIGARVVGGLLGLVWTRLLLEAMGRPLFGLFSSFQSVVALGGLGDLGLGGAVGIQATRHLGRGEEKQLRTFLASTRALFLLLAVVMGGACLVLSPWLPQWLKFSPLPGAGSLTALFMVGAGSVALVALASYVNNLNYGCGNVVWPVLPTLLLSQMAVLVQWLLARQQAPLWLQFLPYLMASCVLLVLGWGFLRCSHRLLTEIFPLRLEWRQMGGWLGQSFWVYLYSLGNLIYTTTDRLLINAAFGPAEVPRYQLNNKLCELVFFAVVAASFVSAPKITQWLASPAAADQERAVVETGRLNRFQIFVGCGAALGYLFINDFFMRVWFGPDLLAPLAWQAAFAANLAVTAGAEVALQITGRSSERGLRLTGMMIGLTAGLNLVLSFLAAKLGSIGGIALATTLAQTILSLILSRFVCRQLNLAWLPWIAKSCGLPLAVVGLATALRFWLPMHSWSQVALLAGAYLLLLLAVAWAVRFNVAFVRDEVRRLAAIFKA